MDNYSTQAYRGDKGSTTVAGSAPIATAQYPGTDQLKALIAYKLAEKAKAEEAAQQRQIASTYAPQQQAPQYGRSYGSGEQAQAVAPQRSDPGIPNYVKMMTGPGMVPGYARAQAGDPGAVFSGYTPRDAPMPSSTSFQGLPSTPGSIQDPSLARNPRTGEMPYDPYSPEARAKKIDYKIRTYNQAGEI